jgi:hypothetical protein
VVRELAAQRQLPTDVLINEILEQHIAKQSTPSRSMDAAFLLSLSGMFQSGVADTSENVRAVVTDFILSKHG